MTRLLFVDSQVQSGSAPADANYSNARLLRPDELLKDLIGYQVRGVRQSNPVTLFFKVPLFNQRINRSQPGVNQTLLPARFRFPEAHSFGLAKAQEEVLFKPFFGTQPTMLNDGGLPAREP